MNKSLILIGILLIGLSFVTAHYASPQDFLGGWYAVMSVSSGLCAISALIGAVVFKE